MNSGRHSNSSFRSHQTFHPFGGTILIQQPTTRRLLPALRSSRTNGGVNVLCKTAPNRVESRSYFRACLATILRRQEYLFEEGKNSSLGLRKASSAGLGYRYASIQTGERRRTRLLVQAAPRQHRGFPTKWISKYPQDVKRHSILQRRLRELPRRASTSPRIEGLQRTSRGSPMPLV